MTRPTPQITIRMDMRCRKCRAKGVVGKTGLCMKCLGKEMMKRRKRKEKSDG